MRTKNEKVHIDMLHPELIRVLHTIESVLNDYGQEMIITSGHEGHPGDGVHKVDSLHYKDGRAIDVRIWNISKDRLPDCQFELTQALNDTLFDIVLEDDHFHIEYDPIVEVTRETDIAQPRNWTALVKKYDTEFKKAKNGHDVKKEAKVNIFQKVWYGGGRKYLITGGVVVVGLGLTALGIAPASTITEVGTWGLLGLGGIDVGKKVIKTAVNSKPEVLTTGNGFWNLVVKILEAVLDYYKKQHKIA